MSVRSNNSTKRRAETTMSEDSIAKRQRQDPENGSTKLIPSLEPTMHEYAKSRKDYLKLLPQNVSAVTWLFSSQFSEPLSDTARTIASSFNITAKEALEEFRRFIALKVFTNDVNAMIISPTPLMDKIWHAAILDTAFYHELQDALGVRIGHRPSGASDKETESREARLIAMRGLYTSFFLANPREADSRTEGRPPLGSIGDSIELQLRIFVDQRPPMHPDGYEYIYADPRTTVSTLKELCLDLTGIPPDWMSIIYKGKEMEDCLTLENHKVVGQDQVDVVVQGAES